MNDEIAALKATVAELSRKVAALEAKLENVPKKRLPDWVEQHIAEWATDILKRMPVRDGAVHDPQ